MTNCGIWSAGEIDFSLIVLEVEGALERSEVFPGISIGRKCRTIPVRSIPIFRPTHAVRHDHDRIGLGDRMRGEYICVKPQAKHLQFSSAFVEVLLGYSFSYSPGNV